jgi:hypothetical protein
MLIDEFGVRRCRVYIGAPELVVFFMDVKDKMN